MRTATSTLIGLGAVLVTTLIFAASGQAQTDATLPAIGGDGGSQFIARCPEGQLLNGFAKQDCPSGLVGVGITGRSGRWLDAVGLICGAPKVTI